MSVCECREKERNRAWAYIKGPQQGTHVLGKLLLGLKLKDQRSKCQGGGVGEVPFYSPPFYARLVNSQKFSPMLSSVSRLYSLFWYYLKEKKVSSFMPCWIIPSVAKVHTHEGWTCYSPGPSLPPPLTSLTQFNRLIPTPLINFYTVMKTKLL